MRRKLARLIFRLRYRQWPDPEQEREPMTRGQAVALLGKGSVKSWNKHRERHPNWKPNISDIGYAAGLSGAKLEGVNLSDARLQYADMNCAILKCADLRRAKLMGSNLASTSFLEANLSGAHLLSASLSGAHLIGTKLNSAVLNKADLTRANVQNATFIGTKGLFGRDRALNMGTVANAESAVFASNRDKVPWSSPLLRSIGTLRLFGISNAAWIGIILYAAGVRWYNRGLTAMQEWAGGEQDAWIQQLPSLPTSPWLGWQLIMLVVLAVGATLYLVLCPDLVKENTETKWTRELKEPLIEYRSAMYSQIIGRYVCLVFYIIGGGYTLIYLAWRVWAAVKTLIS